MSLSLVLSDRDLLMYCYYRCKCVQIVIRDIKKRTFKVYDQVKVNEDFGGNFLSNNVFQYRSSITLLFLHKCLISILLLSEPFKRV